MSLTLIVNADDDKNACMRTAETNARARGVAWKTNDGYDHHLIDGHASRVYPLRLAFASGQQGENQAVRDAREDLRKKYPYKYAREHLANNKELVAAVLRHFHANHPKVHLVLQTNISSTTLYEWIEDTLRKEFPLLEIIDMGISESSDEEEVECDTEEIIRAST